MGSQIESLLSPPIGFAHRGASAHARENTLEAFDLAKKLGATGLESDVWLTADGVAVLDHDGVVRKKLVQRQPIGEILRADLPEHIPSLSEFYGKIGTDLPLSLDVCDANAFSAVIDAAEAANATENLWLCFRDLEQLVAWRPESGAAKLVHSTKLTAMELGAERHAAVLAEHSIDAVNMRNTEWSGGLTTLFHRFGILGFAWDCQHLRVIVEMFDMGTDAIYSDHVDRIAEALTAL